METYRLSIGTIWGLVGVLALLGKALWQLTPMALKPFREGLPSSGVLALYFCSILFMVYAEGYRGFQKGFSPRVVVRAFHLSVSGRWYQIVLAPFFCMGLFHATRRQKTVSWSVLLGVTALVILVSRLSQPWRGVIDAGVVAGLAWGAVAILVYFGRALRGRPIDCSPELPTNP